MKTKTHFFHFLMIPAVTLLALNPLAHGFLGFSSWDAETYLRNLAVLVTVFYGVYLQLFRPHESKHWLVIFLTAVFGVSLSQIGLSWLVWIFSFSLIFSGMRLTILELPLKSFPKDLAAFFAGIFIATLLTPVSLIASVVSFLLVQLIYEMRLSESSPSFPRDRFRDSYKTADRILKSFPS